MKDLEKKIKEFKKRTQILKDKVLEKEIKDLEEFLLLAKEDDSLKAELEDKIKELEKKISQKEKQVFLTGRYDKGNALLQIFAGAGGRDAQDWATMLLRMYQRYCQKRRWQTKIIHQSFGEPGGPEGRIGTKSATLEIKGLYAFGLLKGETGVHRLVRISPFSPKKLRHTSFARVEVLPKIRLRSSEIKIKPEDLKIETFRASGPGGQYVQKRETAVRITHLPTGIVVSCQSERSQLQNKEKAMEILFAKLYQLKQKSLEKELQRIKGGFVSASWGNQIRSYVLHPYKLVKDLRTKVETHNVDSVLDGDLDLFIETEIKLLKPKQ